MNNSIIPKPQLFNGINVVSSQFATTSVPVREHKFTKSQLKHLRKHMFKGITYHDRIQKKWNKRYGLKQVPGMFKSCDPMTGEEVFIAHPVIIEKLKNINERPTIKSPTPSLLDEYNRLKKRAMEIQTIRNIEKWCLFGDSQVRPGLN